MLLKNAFFALFASASFAAAFPGYPDYDKPSVTCSTAYKTKTDVDYSKTTILSTKTIYIPITTVYESPKTTVKPVPVTNVGHSTKTITTVESSVVTKTIPVTTVIYHTKVETALTTKTKTEKVPYTFVKTSYSTEVTKCPVTQVTSKTKTNVETETKKVPHTTTKVETKTVCKTKKGHYY